MKKRAKDLALIAVGIVLGAGVFWFLSDLSDRPDDRKARSPIAEVADDIPAEEADEKPRERLMDRARKAVLIPVPAAPQGSKLEPSISEVKKKTRDAEIETGDETPVEHAEETSADEEAAVLAGAPAAQAGILSLQTLWSGPMAVRLGPTRFPEVVFYVEDVEPLYYATEDKPPQHVWISDRGFEPALFAVDVGQEISIANYGPGLHNVHAFSKVGEFNQAMPHAGSSITKRFKAPQLGIKITCDAHPKEPPAMAYVFDHPYYAVTNAKGHAEIYGLPKGEHTLIATMGEQRTEKRKIRFDGKSGVEVFTFSTDPNAPIHTQPARLSAAN